MSDSTQHTPGKLEQHGVWIFTDVADSAAIAKLEYGGVDSPGFAAAKANARRFVAAWNAVEGVPTEWLEAQFDSDVVILFGKVQPLHTRLQNAMQEAEAAKAERDALKAQRDELLAGLQMAYIAMQHMGNVLNNIDAVDEEEDAQHDAAFEAVAALIAKHKGASHG